jgi:hypothetical protein
MEQAAADIVLDDPEHNARRLFDIADSSIWRGEGLTALRVVICRGAAMNDFEEQSS